MPRIFIGFGSNIDPADNMKSAIKLLSKKVHVLAISNVYKNAAVGRPEQPDFYNCIVEVDTDLHPTSLKDLVLSPIEKALGRERTEDKFAPRTIDLDLLIYGDLIGTTKGMSLPDPLIKDRAFLAVPLAELAPNIKLPGDKRTLKEIAESFVNHGMSPLEDFTTELRRYLENGPE